ncbi:MAG: NAD(P)H-hydrate dehydratase [Acidimicrobiia bacterium]|nr:NAD(P)H-hydrate dehydratase [Acidimicrobiia bacterium]
MIPIVTPAEMAAIDAAAPDGTDVLVERAGAAVAVAAVEMLTGTTEGAAAVLEAGRPSAARRKALAGRRVVIIAGRGNNGADGRAASRHLQRAGAECRIIAPDGADSPSCDLLIDAAYGTGLNRSWSPPSGTEGAGSVLAVDIPSGVDGLTGQVRGGALTAARTVTFAALKPGLLLQPGRRLAGSVSVADIGLDVGSATAQLLTEADVADLWPRREVDAHKWRSACWVVAGSPPMRGAASLASLAALRSGAGYVRLSVPGGEPDASVPTEVVFGRLPAADWHERMDTSRFGSLVVGPGLGRDPQTASAVRALVTRATVPLVLDGDALAALGGDAAAALAAARAPVVLTPHDGEYELLAGQRPGADRLAAARALAAAGATVLLKGSTTVVAAPDGAARFVTSGDARLATAGTGDVLAGMIGALLAQGTAALDAAALAAQVHGMAGALGPPVGLIAGDLLGAIPAVLAGALDPAHQGFGAGAGSR